MRTWSKVCDALVSPEKAKAFTELGQQVGRHLVHLGEVATDPFLADGLSGHALLLAHLASVEPNTWIEPTSRCMGTISMLLDSTPSLPSMYSGYLGPAWICRHLQQTGLAHFDDVEEVTRAVDNSVASAIRDGKSHYDLIFGLVGIGAYLLSQTATMDTDQPIRLLVSKLAALAEPGYPGCRWRSPLPSTPTPNLPFYQRGLYDLGMAHGVGGMIGLLSHVVAAGLGGREARRLLTSATSWLLAQRLPTHTGSTFPSFIVAGLEQARSRLAWCYGDAGLAIALLCASRALGAPDIGREAVRMALDAAKRFDTSGVKDAGLCHGSAGLVLIFCRLYQISGHAEFLAAARRWLTDIMTQWRHDGDCLFPAFDPPSARYTPVHGFLAGQAGVALLLFDLAQRIAPDWDQILLISGPALCSD